MPPFKQLLKHYTAGFHRHDAITAIICLVVIGLLWLLTVERINYERAESIADAVSINDNLALAFDEHTTLSLKVIDNSLLLIKHEYEEEHLRPKIAAMISSGLIDAKNYAFIGILDERGNVTAGSQEFKPTNLADREFFKIHQERADYGLFVGRPILGRLTGRWVIQTSRRLNKTDGSFGGVVFIGLDTKYFTTFYERANLGANGMVQLVGLDGITLARRAGSVSSFGDDARKTTLFAKQAERSAGSYLNLGRREGVRRYVSYRTLKDFPLIVAVGAAETDVLKGFHARERDYYLGAAAASVILLIFVFGFSVISARQKRMQLLLAGSEERFRSLIENVSDLIVLVNIRGKIEFISPSIRQVGGYDVSEIMGRNFLDFAHPDDQAAARKEFLEIVRGRTARVKVEKRFRHKNGNWLTLESLARNALDDPLLNGIIINARDITERKRAAQELEFRNTILSTQQESALDAILVVDADRKIISHNQQFVDLWRLPPELVRGGDHSPVLQSVAAQMADPAAFLARADYLYGHKEEKSRDELKLKDGRIVDRYSSPMIGANGEYYGRSSYFRDVTEQKNTAERIAKLNMLYATLSGGNAAIVRSRSRPELCQRICDVASKQGGWAGAWIGFIDKATQRIVPEAWSDSMAAYINKMVVSVDPAVPEGRGPTGHAVRTGTPYFCNDIFADPATLPWRQFATDFGIAAVASVPLRLGKDFVGVVNLYAKRANFYTPDVQALLLELGGDISFALDMFDREAHRQKIERELVENEEKFRGLIEQTIAGIYIIQNERFAYVNPRFAEIVGYEMQELIGMEVVQIVDEPYRAVVLENIRKRMSGMAKSVQYTAALKRKDGSSVEIGVHGSRATFQGAPAVIGIMQDITERRKIEEREKHYIAQLELSMVGTVNAVSAMVELRDPYTSGHERRVGEIAAAIGAELGLKAEQVKGLRIIGNVHDVGKIAAPAELLSKPGKLSAIEFEIIKTHAQQGYEILKDIDFPWPVAQTVLQHHERFDGSGYPQGLKGDQIVIEARILAVADTIEAMSSHRPYRAGLGIDAALKEIEAGSGQRYDPQVAAACLRLFREKNYRIPD